MGTPPQTDTEGRQSMDLGLSKLPWYGQIAAFLVVAVAGFLVFHTTGWCRSRTTWRCASRSSTGSASTSTEPSKRRVSSPAFEASVAELDARLESLRAVLPEKRMPERCCGGGSGLASELRAQGDFLSVAACEVRPEARKPVTHVHGP